MSKSINTYVPINQLDNYSDRIQSSITLPQYVDSSRVLVNAGMIHFISAFSGTEIRFNTTREDDGVSATITGFDEQGNAYAGQIKKSSAPTMKTSSEEGMLRMGLHAFRRRIVNVDINMAAVENRIRDRKESLRSEEAWANSLNPVIRDGVRKGNNHSLLRGMHVVDWGMAALWYIGVLSVAASTARDGITPADLGPVIWEGFKESTLVFIPSFLLYKALQTPHESIYSFFGPSGPKFDRALVVSVVSRFSNFVKVGGEDGEE